MKEFVLEIPRITTNATIIEDVRGFDVKEIVVIATSAGTRVLVKYEGVTTYEDGETA